MTEKRYYISVIQKKIVKMVGRHTMDSEEPSNIRNEFSIGRVFCDSTVNKMHNNPTLYIESAAISTNY